MIRNGALRGYVGLRGGIGVSIKKAEKVAKHTARILRASINLED